MPSPICDVGLKGGLITGGLGRPACKGMITMLPFQLGCFEFRMPTKAVSGGSIPLHPGEIADFYQPIDDLNYTEVDTDQPAQDGDLAKPETFGKKMAKLIIKSDKFGIEKEFMLTDRKAKAVVKIMNLANVTMNSMKVAVNNFKRAHTGIKVSVQNFQKRYWK